jgi:hypothetical protein
MRRTASELKSVMKKPADAGFFVVVPKTLK